MIGYPKTGSKKRRKKHRMSIMQQSRYCYLCEKEGRIIEHGLEEHHIFGGPMRNKSEEYGLKVWLCIPHHRTGRDAVHRNADIRKKLQAEAEQEFDRKYSERTFFQVFGKHYSY